MREIFSLYIMVGKPIPNRKYQEILTFYRHAIPNSKKRTKIFAQNLLSRKMCSCLKKLEPKFGSKAIGICTKTVFLQKGLQRGRFQCRGTPRADISIRRRRCPNGTRKNKRSCRL